MKKNESKCRFSLLSFLLGMITIALAFFVYNKSSVDNDPWAEPWEKSSEPIDDYLNKIYDEES